MGQLEEGLLECRLFLLVFFAVQVDVLKHLGYAILVAHFDRDDLSRRCVYARRPLA